MRRWGRNAVVTASAALLVACGSALDLATGPTAAPSPVTTTDAAGPSRPYDGPMVVPVAGDASDVIARSGAAGQALECDGTPAHGGRYGEEPFAVEDSAGAALAAFDHELWSVPPRGYRVEREDEDRVLFSFDVDRRSKAVLIVADGLRDHEGGTGWVVETWATCDPSEWPAALTDELGIQVWQDAAGRRVPLSRIRSGAGPEHCDWQDVTFLWVGDPRTGRQFLGRPTDDLARYLLSTYEARTTLPRDATDTGFRREGRSLWLDPDGKAAYLVSSTSVERWPATKQRIACA